ncbi:hypothetical protein F2Q69_00030253 [Brassica cretica]|uniref:Uncharacterized protein n=1 Tax=Brassica cretica TaxID=69181 RepID=A0A8S9S0B5_BRACR|nr:hypothetical protein F2Q69_00030253 [Brassica cretica]
MLQRKKKQARQARVQLEEIHKGLRMLNNGTYQLDHLLSIGQSDQCGLGFKGKSSKVRGHIRPRCFKLLREKRQMEQTYGMRSHSPICYCGVQRHARRDGFDSGQGANHGGIRLMDTWSGRSGHYGDDGMRFYPRHGGWRSSLLCLTECPCTWCCEVVADVTCGGVVRCIVVTKLCIGVDVCLGIFGVRLVLTYSVTYLVKYLVTYFQRLRG